MRTMLAFEKYTAFYFSLKVKQLISEMELFLCWAKLVFKTFILENFKHESRETSIMNPHVPVA